MNFESVFSSVVLPEPVPPEISVFIRAWTQPDSSSRNSAGIEPFWMNDRDAAVAGIADNDWVEIYNDHGVVCTRACVSARVPRGMGMIYHAPERTLTVPKSRERGNRRAGGHNSLTRVRLKPLFMIGGYAQFTYAFNYWGPTGVNRDTYVVVKRMPKVAW